MIDLKQVEVWFVTGSQHLYGPETLETVAEHAREIAAALDTSAQLPVNVRFKPVLTTPEAILETGIEILAQPPGKKLGNIELMSGGEKALTAVALIFAIFQYKPSPFCILDEVDAPLDEANVGRYCDMIREMTDKSQFILITHIKKTMQMVDMLHGVTMGEPGVSRLVSVKISEAAQAKKVDGKDGKQVAVA